MKIQVRRHTFTDKSTIGSLYVDGKFECYTLEDKVREVKSRPVSAWKVAGKTAIPYGVYKCVIDFSARFKKLMPLLLDVEGFSGVRIHKGNHDGNTEGCLLVGDVLGVDWIGKSTDAYDVLFAKIKRAIHNGIGVTVEIVKGVK